jgi:hypothetical protein
MSMYRTQLQRFRAVRLYPSGSPEFQSLALVVFSKAQFISQEFDVAVAHDFCEIRREYAPLKVGISVYISEGPHSFKAINRCSVTTLVKQQLFLAIFCDRDQSKVRHHCCGHDQHAE